MSRTWTVKLPVKLDEDEILQMGRNNARIVQEVLDEKGALKDVQKQMKLSIERKEGDIVKHSNDIRRGYVDREVECTFMNYDFQKGTKDVVRMDTGEVIETEEITEDERQQNLHLTN